MLYSSPSCTEASLREIFAAETTGDLLKAIAALLAAAGRDYLPPRYSVPLSFRIHLSRRHPTYALPSICPAPETIVTEMLKAFANRLTASGQLCQSSSPTWISQETGARKFPA